MQIGIFLAAKSSDYLFILSLLFIIYLVYNRHKYIYTYFLYNFLHNLVIEPFQSNFFTRFISIVTYNGKSARIINLSRGEGLVRIISITRGKDIIFSPCCVRIELVFACRNP